MMEKKKGKYDTNPLDPDVARRTDEVWNGGESSAAGTSEVDDRTREIGRRTLDEETRPVGASEAPTRRYDTPVGPASYPSVFVPPTYTPPSPYMNAQPPRPAHYGAAYAKTPPTSRTVPGLGLPENIAMLLPYLPLPVIGAVAGAVELFLIPRSETRVRFHAAQGLALHLVVLCVGFLFNFADNIPIGRVYAVIMGIASALFTIASMIFFIISIIRVSKGEEHRITQLSEATRWLDEKIDPRKP
jgi:uncharacterized membrane protein